MTPVPIRTGAPSGSMSSALTAKPPGPDCAGMSARFARRRPRPGASSEIASSTFRLARAVVADQQIERRGALYPRLAVIAEVGQQDTVERHGGLWRRQTDSVLAKGENSVPSSNTSTPSRFLSQPTTP